MPGILTTQIQAYLSQNYTFVDGLKPSDALQLPAQQVLYVLEKKLGNQFYPAFNPEKTIESPLKAAATEPLPIQSAGGRWLRHVNMVGINVRTVGHFWNVVKYAFTLPESQNSIHLLPIWEPGVVASLYGMSSWQINPEFFSTELHEAMPHLDTVEKQLKVTINILHALGKTVGMDVIPHTDRFSEQVIANPQLFEWVQRVDTHIIRHDNNLHEYVQDLIFEYLRRVSPTVLPASKELFFSKNFPESERLLILFGAPHHYAERAERRAALVQYLYDHHLETVPATMGPPYRGIEVDTKGAVVIDEKGRTWRDYKITKPETFSRVFGPLTRYKLFENKNNNAAWEIDFSKPIRANWDYVARHYAAIQRQYNFDFMRGDMAHVQMRPEGVPTEGGEYYDILGFIKNYIIQQNNVPYFGSFAETFLAPAGEMAFGDELDHLEMSASDTTLGDLQSMVVGSPRFMAELRRYLDIAATRLFAPNFTMITGDKDDPRFDNFYLKGNEIRFFIGLFLTDIPSYMGLGFELRDPHPTPAPNEHYTKLYVFKIDSGEKATKSAYQWGQNELLFNCISSIRHFADKVLPAIKTSSSQWLIPPDPTGNKKVIAWTQAPQPRYLFIANLDTELATVNIRIPPPPFFNLPHHLTCVFSTNANLDKSLSFNGLHYCLAQLEAGQGLVFAI